MEATDWERNLSHGHLPPTQTERVLKRVLKIVSYGCRVACSKRGDSRKGSIYTFFNNNTPHGEQR